MKRAAPAVVYLLLFGIAFSFYVARAAAEQPLNALPEMGDGMSEIAVHEVGEGGGALPFPG